MRHLRVVPRSALGCPRHVGCIDHMLGPIFKAVFRGPEPDLTLSTPGSTLCHQKESMTGDGIEQWLQKLANLSRPEP